MNLHGIWAIYKFEMHRFARTLWTGHAVPVITTSLYFVVFGSAIGSRMSEINGIDYGSFIVPGLMMLSLFTESIFNASFGIHMPRFTGTIYEILSAMRDLGIGFKDLDTKQSSLEDIFVRLVHDKRRDKAA